MAHWKDFMTDGHIAGHPEGTVAPGGTPQRKSIPGWLMQRFAEEARVKREKRLELEDAATHAVFQMKKAESVSSDWLRANGLKVSRKGGYLK